MTNETMTKKNLKPLQAAPVQREINTISSVVDGTGEGGSTGLGLIPQFVGKGSPFAGDDAE